MREGSLTSATKPLLTRGLLLGRPPASANSTTSRSLWLKTDSSLPEKRDQLHIRQSRFSANGKTKQKPDREGGLPYVRNEALANARASAWAATCVRQFDDQPFLMVED